MARRSNKTAHVLNLLAGHDAQNDSQNEPQTSAEGADGTEASATAKPKTAAPSAPAEKEPERSAPVVQAAPQNISVIDKTEDDPVADLIQQKLMDEFEQSQQDSGNHDAAEATDDTALENEAISSAIETISNTEPDSTAEEVADAAFKEAIADSSSDTETKLEDPVDTIVEVAEDSAPSPETTPAAAETSSALSSEAAPAASVTDTTEETVAAGDATAPDNTSEVRQTVSQTAAPEPEPEPEFAYLNIMERIVEDKIIYFMRQFDVCTCGRCKADTIALTMNGLMPKYIVTTPAAVDPLLSYYTNRLISDVTVEATKACMIVKDNPRH